MSCVTNILILASIDGIDINKLNAELVRVKVVMPAYSMCFKRVDDAAGGTGSMSQRVYGTAIVGRIDEDCVLERIGAVAAQNDHSDGWYVHAMVNTGENAWSMYDFHADGSYDSAGL